MTKSSARTSVIIGTAVATGLLGLVPSGTARASSTILVTTTTQGIAVEGCSLQEAILAADADSSVVADPDGIGTLTTGCLAGSGDDVIELAGGTYSMTQPLDDATNYTGPTGTPLIESSITIEGRGAIIERAAGAPTLRAFAVGPTGHLDLREVHVRNFEAKGGDGANGGGGGLGAGGAIYVHDGSLLVQWSTFEYNGATGGNGSGGNTVGSGGGGGGLGGNGGAASEGTDSQGGGGGGSRGDGAAGYGVFLPGGGGGTMSDAIGVNGGYRCGGDGGEGGIADAPDGDDGGCNGGGGGGGGDVDGLVTPSGSGGSGAYGGGGGGGGYDSGDGGPGGFGGGGGAGPAFSLPDDKWFGGSGGDGGFGGGGGAGPGGAFFGEPGDGGTFGGDADSINGGGGAGLGGAIFGHSATVTVSNSTFTRNYAVRGVANVSPKYGQDKGGAIFTVAGSLTVTNTTIAGNEATGNGAGLVVYKPTTGEATSLTMRNTLIANNGGRDECHLINGVAASGANNLVTPHDADVLVQCPGVTQTGDPMLGAMAVNPPGTTPTMALLAGSPAIDTGTATGAPADDQRGVARPQGAGVDIGAYELGSPDVIAPAASSSRTLTPPANAAGWNTADVTVGWGWTDNAGGWGIDPDQCPPTTTSVGEGADVEVTEECTDLAGNAGSATHVVKVDMTAPTVTCGPAPTFTIGGAGGEVSAAVTDALSGPAATPVTATVTATDVATAGAGSKEVTGADVAGNTTKVECSYTVAYGFLGFLEPIPQSNYKRGSTVPVKFALGDASGIPISDTAALALLSPTCSLHVTLDGVVQGCARYNAVSDIFQYDIKTPKKARAGEHTIGIRVTAGGAVVNDDLTTVLLR